MLEILYREVDPTKIVMVMERVREVLDIVLDQENYQKYEGCIRKVGDWDHHEVAQMINNQIDQISISIVNHDLLDETTEYKSEFFIGSVKYSITINLFQSTEIEYFVINTPYGYLSYKPELTIYESERNIWECLLIDTGKDFIFRPFKGYRISIPINLKSTDKKFNIIMNWILNETKGRDYKRGLGYFTEIFILHILRRYFSNVPDLIWVPAEEFVDNPGNGKDKSADIILCVYERERRIYLPILAIDITLREPLLIEKAGYITSYEVPVIGLSLYGLPRLNYFGRRVSFVEFVKKIVRVNIIKGYYDSDEPLKGIDETSSKSFLVQFRSYLIAAIRDAHNDLMHIHNIEIINKLRRATDILGIPLASI
jgi:hypothetical protein